MGLDQYLKASFYVSGYNRTEKPQDKFNLILDAVGASGLASNDSPSVEVHVTIMYWRKANAIHKWFVDSVQKGVDDCKSYYVQREQLEELVFLCKAASANTEVAKKELPTASGFFFGGTEYDDYYRQQLLDTVKTIESILGNPRFANVSFYYQSSW